MQCICSIAIHLRIWFQTLSTSCCIIIVGRGFLGPTPRVTDMTALAHSIRCTLFRCSRMNWCGGRAKCGSSRRMLNRGNIISDQWPMAVCKQRNSLFPAAAEQLMQHTVCISAAGAGSPLQQSGSCKRTVCINAAVARSSLQQSSSCCTHLVSVLQLPGLHCGCRLLYNIKQGDIGASLLAVAPGLPCGKYVKAHACLEINNA